jgi:hypothetical protein
MLRITVQAGETATTMRLEGRVAGPEVNELARCWLAEVTADPHVSVVVDLKGVTHIDGTGKELLAEMHNRGAEFVTEGFEARLIIEEIRRKSMKSGAQSRKRSSQRIGREHD